MMLCVCMRSARPVITPSCFLGESFNIPLPLTFQTSPASFSLLPLLLSDKVALRKESARCISALAPHVSSQLFTDIFSRLCDALAAPRVDVRTTAAIGLQLLTRDAAERVPCSKIVPLLIGKLEEAIVR